MISQKYWDKFYSKRHKFNSSPFAKFVVDYLRGELVDLGCGNGRDLKFFRNHGLQSWGVDEISKAPYITTQDVGEYIKEYESPDNVYTRFFWHAINRKRRLTILKWTKKNIFIEARTTEDKPKDIYGKHDRILVDVPELVKDLKDNGFTIGFMREGYNMSKFKGENPHLIRIFAYKK